MKERGKPGARRALALLLALNILCYLDRYILAAVEPEIRRTFFAPEDPNAMAKTGALATAFLVSYMVLSPLFGWLADKHSRWAIIATGAAIWSLATAGSGWAPTFGLLLAARILVGAGEAAYGPPAPAVLSDLFPPAAAVWFLPGSSRQFHSAAPSATCSEARWRVRLAGERLSVSQLFPAWSWRLSAS